MTLSISAGVILMASLSTTSEATGSTELFKVITNNSSSLKTQISFTANGGATFSSTVRCDVSGVSNSSLNTTYGLTSYNISADNATYLARFTSGGGAGEVAAIKADGSAEFDGEVLIGSGKNVNAGTNGAHVKLRDLNGIVVTTNNQPNFRGYNFGSGAPTSQINADGTASFAGAITAATVNGASVVLTSATEDDIDVRARLVAARQTFEDLCSAVKDATDFTSLKAALTTALSDYSTY